MLRGLRGRAASGWRPAAGVLTLQARPLLHPTVPGSGLVAAPCRVFIRVTVKKWFGCLVQEIASLHAMDFVILGLLFDSQFAEIISADVRLVCSTDTIFEPCQPDSLLVIR